MLVKFNPNNDEDNLSKTAENTSTKKLRAYSKPTKLSRSLFLGAHFGRFSLKSRLLNGLGLLFYGTNCSIILFNIV